MTATAWITGGGELPVGTPLDGGDAAEVQVPARPRVHPLSRLLQLLRRLVRPAALDLDDAVLDVEPRVVDRLVDREAAGDDVVDRLQDRPGEPDRPGAADDEARSCRRRARASAPSCSAAGLRRGAPRCRSRRARPACCSAGTPCEKTPEPDPSVDESAAALPSPSITETWVVPVSGASLRRPAVPGPEGAARARRASEARVAGSVLSGVELCEPRGDDGTPHRRRRARDDPHPAERRLERPTLDHSVRRDVGGELGDELGDRGRAVVSQPLEPGNHHRCLRANVRAVDAAALVRALEDRDEDLEQEPLRAPSSRPPPGRARAPARTAPPTGAARGGRAPRRALPRARARRPTTRRRGTPASRRPRSRSAPRPSGPAAVRGRRRSSRAASAPGRRRAGAGSRRRRARSAALRRRTRRGRRRRRRRRRCLRVPRAHAPASAV